MFEAIFNKSVLGERPSYDLFRIKGFTCSFRQKNNFTIEIELDIPENFHLDRFSTSGKEYKRDIANYYTRLDEQFEKASTTEPKIHNYILGMCKCLRIRLSETIGPFAGWNIYTQILIWKYIVQLSAQLGFGRWWRVKKENIVH